MGDSIPNSEYTLECFNPKCKHMNLKWRFLCVICGWRLSREFRTGIYKVKENDAISRPEGSKQ